MLKLRIAVMLAVALASSGAGAQSYPIRPVRIVTGGVGGVNDIVSRLIAQEFTSAWGQPVIVDNRPSGIIPGDIVAKAPPDGYTLLVIGNSFWTSQFLRKVPYDAVRDFTPISLMINSPSILVVHPSLPVKTVKDLIDYARAKPGELTFGSTGVGGPQHIGGELFDSMAGIRMLHVPYKATGAVIAALIGGQVQVVFASALAVEPHIAAGRLRGLGVTTLKPTPVVPGMVPIAATVPGYELPSPQALFAPAKTPQAVISKVNQDVVRILNRADVREKLLTGGVEVIASSPAELTTAVRTDQARIGKLIKDAGITGE
jgi:tripartite-type tricarboxylate transporter receptor subunit TctC